MIIRTMRYGGGCRRAVPRLSVPAGSLPGGLGSLPGQIGSLLGRVGKRVRNYLIPQSVLTMARWIFGAESIFLPAFPVLQGITDRSRRAGSAGAARGVAASPQ